MCWRRLNTAARQILWLPLTMRTRWSSLWKCEFLNLLQSSYTFTIGLIPATCTHYAKWNTLFVDAIIGLFFYSLHNPIAQWFFWILHCRFALCNLPLPVRVLSLPPGWMRWAFHPLRTRFTLDSCSECATRSASHSVCRRSALILKVNLWVSASNRLASHPLVSSKEMRHCHRGHSW